MVSAQILARQFNKEIIDVLTFIGNADALVGAKKVKMWSNMTPFTAYEEWVRSSSAFFPVILAGTPEQFEEAMVHPDLVEWGLSSQWQLFDAAKKEKVRDRLRKLVALSVEIFKAHRPATAMDAVQNIMSVTQSLLKQ